MRMQKYECRNANAEMPMKCNPRDAIAAMRM